MNHSFAPTTPPDNRNRLDASLSFGPSVSRGGGGSLNDSMFSRTQGNATLNESLTFNNMSNNMSMNTSFNINSSNVGHMPTPASARGHAHDVSFTGTEQQRTFSSNPQTMGSQPGLSSFGGGGAASTFASRGAAAGGGMMATPSAGGTQNSGVAFCRKIGFVVENVH